MSYRLPAAAGLFLLLVVTFAAAEDWPEPNCGKAPKSFNKQYEHIVHSYRKSDEAGMKAAVESFRIPQPRFIEEFGPEKGTVLQKQYADEFEYYEWETLRHFHWIDKTDDSTIDTQVCEKAPVPPAKPAPDALVAMPVTKMISIRYTKTNGTFAAFGRTDRMAHSVSWGDLYAEIDGRYRFLGRGAYPFWSPVCVLRADMCTKPGEQTGGALVNRIEPEYPEEARLAGKQGTVRLCVTVAVDGSVANVEIVDGDPVLAPAAKATAMRWRYSPFMNCGKPVEMHVLESVKFPSPS